MRELLTSPATRLTSSLILLFSLVSGCGSLFADNREPPATFGPREQIYFASFDQVWRATQLALQKYPIRVNNMDLGVLETDNIKGYKVWMPPHRKSASGGLSYKLNVRVVKGVVDGRSSVRVTVMKDTEMKKDFFASSKKLPSDGLEERSILYRIKRELLIDKALQKAQKKMNRS